VYHEYTYYYLASQFAAQYSPWVNEGARGDQNVMPCLTAGLRYAHTIEQKRWALEKINALRAKAAAPQAAAGP
jgi:hypothetical protein